MERHGRASIQTPAVVLHVLLAATTAGLTLLGTLVAAEPAPRSAEVAGPLLAGLMAAAVLAAIRWPRLALVTALAAVLAYHLADFPAIGLAWPLAIVLYLTAASGAALPAAVLMAVSLVGSGIWRLLVEHHPVLTVADGVAREAGLVAIALLLGEVVHRRAAWRQEVARRFADRQRERDREQRHDAAQRRLAIAREVHDTVAHTLAVVGVQADVAAETLRHDDPARAVEAIEVVRRTNKRALQELRTTVALLRGDIPEADPRQPVPNLTDLPALTAHVGDSGLQVDLRSSVDLGDVPSPVGITAYRVVQEALTNVVRHADATSASVDLRLDDGHLLVEVTDNGHATAPTSVREGNGVRGMRERAQTVGGRLHVEPMPAGGFRVHLSAPIEGEP